MAEVTLTYNVNVESITASTNITQTVDKTVEGFYDMTPQQQWDELYTLINKYAHEINSLGISVAPNATKRFGSYMNPNEWTGYCEIDGQHCWIRKERKTARSKSWKHTIVIYNKGHSERDYQKEYTVPVTLKAVA